MASFHYSCFNTSTNISPATASKEGQPESRGKHLNWNPRWHITDKLLTQPPRRGRSAPRTRTPTPPHTQVLLKGDKQKINKAWLELLVSPPARVWPPTLTSVWNPHGRAQILSENNCWQERHFLPTLPQLPTSTHLANSPAASLELSEPRALGRGTPPHGQLESPHGMTSRGLGEPPNQGTLKSARRLRLCCSKPDHHPELRALPGRTGHTPRSPPQDSTLGRGPVLELGCPYPTSHHACLGFLIYRLDMIVVPTSQDTGKDWMSWYT